MPMYIVETCHEYRAEERHDTMEAAVIACARREREANDGYARIVTLDGRIVADVDGPCYFDDVDPFASHASVTMTASAGLRWTGPVVVRVIASDGLADLTPTLDEAIVFAGLMCLAGLAPRTVDVETFAFERVIGCLWFIDGSIHDALDALRPLGVDG